MKLNIAYPATGCQKLFDFEDEKKVRIFYDKRMSQEVDGSSLGEEWKGYIFRITGGNDKQGFPMKQGVLTNQRVRLLLSKGHSCYRPRRDGERRRKSVRGCIVDANLSVLSLVIVKKGEQEIPGLTDSSVPRRLGPKRASKIRKLFNLTKEDDVRQYVLRRPLPIKEGSKRKKPKTKAPKIQRLITPAILQRRRRKLMKFRQHKQTMIEEAAAYAKLLAQRMKEKRRRSSASRTSTDSRKTSVSTTDEKTVKTAEKKQVKPKDTAKKSQGKETPKKGLKESKPASVSKKSVGDAKKSGPKKAALKKDASAKK